MSEEWFDKYLESDFFKGAEHFFSINRFESRPDYDTDINILRYKLHDYEKIHFKVNNYEKYYFVRNKIFFYERKEYESQFFEFIGKKLI